MQVKDVDLVMSAVAPKQYPKTGLPEIGLIGRSNVGKSSLTNVLIDRKNYAHTSGAPGKTQTLNFYRINDDMYFVDVPGYGYAKVSKADRAKWAQMIETYLTNRKPLKGVISLIDGRHDPQKMDLQIRDWLEYYQIPVLYVATKTDKIAKSKRPSQENNLRTKLQLGPEEPLVMFSAKTKDGKDKIWSWIEKQIKQ